jgi:rhamnose utilization protein RhaD (predicted bifunctional aldolase and dehydrogenase)
MMDLTELRRISALVGADRFLVQAAGGNTSLKADGVMWIKASGTWLMEAERRDIFVPVAIDPLLAALKRDDPACEACVDFLRRDLNASGLRPSIETTVHAIMPQRVVVHVHCVETIAWAVRADAEARLAKKLKGFHYAFIPYRRPGLPLSRAIAERLKSDTDVLILGNHGLVVAAETVADAEALLSRVVAALKRPVRKPVAGDVEKLAAVSRDTQFAPVSEGFMHSLATDEVSLGHVGRGSLYPDHVVFLGASVGIIEDGESPEDAVARIANQGRPPPRLILVPGAGALLPRSDNPSALAMTGCLADVAARLDADDPVTPITRDDELALVNWDAEKYRQALKT